MKLFKPKAPVLPPNGTPIQFRFAGDFVRPVVAEVDLAPAIARVASEIAKLRNAVDAAGGLSTATAIESKLAKVIRQQGPADKERNRMQLQLGSGVITKAEYQPFADAANKLRNARINLQEELRVRTEADSAAVQLRILLAALQ